jgi:hypothetical protein
MGGRERAGALSRPLTTLSGINAGEGANKAKALGLHSGNQGLQLFLCLPSASRFVMCAIVRYTLDIAATTPIPGANDSMIACSSEMTSPFGKVL